MPHPKLAKAKAQRIMQMVRLVECGETVETDAATYVASQLRTNRTRAATLIRLARLVVMTPDSGPQADVP